MPDVNKRIESLDWLRGLLALSVMAYNITTWHFFDADSGSVIGRIGGIYSVPMFFVLSGLSIAYVYHGVLSNYRSSAAFLIRRVFRIWPVMWLATFLTLIPSIMLSDLLYQHSLPWAAIALNLTTSFGFLAPEAAIAFGGWSIGNEMVFYLYTPILLLAYDKSKTIGNILTIVSLCFGAFFAFFMINPAIPLAPQGAIYVNPMNNVFLYCLGVCGFYNLRHMEIRPKYLLLILCVCLAGFVLYPVDGNLARIVSGPERMFFSLISILVVFCFYKLEWSPHAGVSRVLLWLGKVSYSLYLLHPIVHTYLTKATMFLALSHPWVDAFGTAVVSLAVATFVYRYIELPLQGWGKVLAKEIG